MARDGRQAAPGQVLRDDGEVDTIDGAVPERSLARLRDHPDVERNTGNLASLPQPRCVADHQGTAALIDRDVRERLHDDLGTDARRVAHGDRNDRPPHPSTPPFRNPVPIFNGAQDSTLRPRIASRHRTRVMRSPNAPALVMTGSPIAPKADETGTPGSTSPRILRPDAPERARTAWAVSPPVATRPPKRCSRGATRSAKDAETCRPSRRSTPSLPATDMTRSVPVASEASIRS